MVRSCQRKDIGIRSLVQRYSVNTSPRNLSNTRRHDITTHLRTQCSSRWMKLHKPAKIPLSLENSLSACRLCWIAIQTSSASLSAWPDVLTSHPGGSTTDKNLAIPSNVSLSRKRGFGGDARVRFRNNARCGPTLADGNDRIRIKSRDWTCIERLWSLLGICVKLSKTNRSRPFFSGGRSRAGASGMGTPSSSSQPSSSSSSSGSP